MKKFTFAAALSLATILPFATAPAFAETADKQQASVCTQTPAKAAKADVDCTATSSFIRDEDKAAKKYPSAPTNFGNGVVF